MDLIDLKTVVFYRTFNSSSSNDSSLFDHVESYDLNGEWSNNTGKWNRCDGIKLSQLVQEVGNVNDIYFSIPADGDGSGYYNNDLTVTAHGSWRHYAMSVSQFAGERIRLRAGETLNTLFVYCCHLKLSDDSIIHLHKNTSYVEYKDTFVYVNLPSNASELYLSWHKTGSGSVLPMFALEPLDGLSIDFPNLSNAFYQVGSVITCSSGTTANTKSITVSGFTLAKPTRFLVKFTNRHQGSSSVSLQVNSETAKPLYYNGEIAFATNTWQDGETVEVFYDGTNFQSYPIIPNFKDKCRLVGIIHVDNGQYLSGGASNTSLFLPILDTPVYVTASNITTNASLVTYYNKDKEFLQSNRLTDTTYEISKSAVSVDGAYYYRLSMLPESTEVVYDAKEWEFEYENWKEEENDNEIGTLSLTKLDKQLSRNIINPDSITASKYIKANGTLGDSSGYAVTDLIDVQDIDSITMFGIVNSASVLTFAVYNESKIFLRGSYADAGVATTYTKQSGDAFVRIGLRDVNISQLYPMYFACLGNTMLDYDEYSDYTPLRDLKEMVSRTMDTSSGTLTPISCPTLYSIANDVASQEFVTINSSYDYVQNVYADHFFDFELGKERPVRWKDNNLDKLPLVNPVVYSGDSLQFNNGQEVWQRTETKHIISGLSDVAVSLPRISILNSVTANFFPKVLFIGDSVTEGSGSWAPLELTHPQGQVSDMYSTYWSFIWKLFMDDKVRNGNTGFDFLSLGVRATREVKYGNNWYRISAEGNGGWKIRDYLYDITFNPLSGDNNRFYDADKIGHWSDSDLNNAGVAFSISKFLERYKTLADDGVTRLVVGSTTGTEVTDATKYNVCTPDIISIQMGFNDVQENYIGDLKLMIKAIREEYPNMPIIVSLIDGSGTYNKELYPEINPADISLTHATHHKMHALMAQIQTETLPSGVFILPSYFVQSTGYGVALKPYMQPQDLISQYFKPYYVENGSSPDLHPGVFAHCDWAYQYAALIKYIMYINEE